MKVTKERIREIESKLEDVEKTIDSVKEICKDMRKEVTDDMYG